LTRSNLTVDLDKCTGCGVCIDACPEEAIKLERKELAAPKLSGTVDIDLDKCRRAPGAR